MKKTVCIIVALFTALSLAACGGSKKGDESSSPAPMTLENYVGDRPQVEIVLSGYGSIVAELYPAIAPKTVANFLMLVDTHYYDGLSFHRIIDGFMMQGGGPDAESPSLKAIEGEFSANGTPNTISHVRGTLSMARTPEYNSATSQFFIVHQDATYLDGNYAGFGRVLQGMEIVDKICQNTPVEDKNGTVLPENRPYIETIRRVG